MIRFILGLIITMAAAGADDAAPIWQIVAVAAVGLSLMYWASRDLDSRPLR